MYINIFAAVRALILKACIYAWNIYMCVYVCQLGMHIDAWNICGCQLNQLIHQGLQNLYCLHCCLSKNSVLMGTSLQGWAYMHLRSIVELNLIKIILQKCFKASQVGGSIISHLLELEQVLLPTSTAAIKFTSKAVELPKHKLDGSSINSTGLILFYVKSTTFHKKSI